VWAPGAVWTFWRRGNSFRTAGSKPAVVLLLSNHSTDSFIPAHVFLKVENFLYIFKLIESIKALISTATLLHEI
jgi:hypothetical protein